MSYVFVLHKSQEGLFRFSNVEKYQKMSILQQMKIVLNSNFSVQEKLYWKSSAHLLSVSTADGCFSGQGRIEQSGETAWSLLTFQWVLRPQLFRRQL